MNLNIMAEQETETVPYDPQVQIFKVLTHPARLAILEILRDGEHCVCHMEAHLGFRQAYISQQLSVLRDAGLVQDRRDGWNIFLRKVRERKITRRTKCTACQLIALCGMCPANAYLENQDPETPIEFFCQVAHLRAQALGIPVKPHGGCEYCE